MKEYIEKNEARQMMRVYRKSLALDEAAGKCRLICENLFDSGIIFSDIHCILSFASYGTEPDTGIIDDMFRQYNNRIIIAYPKVLEDRENMEFYAVNCYDDMKQGYLNIREPDGKSDCIIPKEKGQYIMIVPGLAFDTTGARAGYGGGFYDRYLERYPDITKVAICYDEQLLRDRYIMRNEHDILMDYIITDKNILKIMED